MEQVLLARWQFGITTIYHFLFVPLTLGLSLVVAFLQTRYVMTGDEKYKQLTKFWGKLFLINFAMGVVTGIVQEFQFGMNWSGYSRFVGDIFGAPLAIEALVAFFIESTFLGIWIFGWDKLPKSIHLASIWLVAIASNLSAYFILVANSFMQNPVGYTLNNGRAEMTDFFAVLSNPYVAHQFGHVFTAGLTTAAFFVIGISAYHLLKKNNPALFKISFKYGVILGLVATIAVMGAGHTSGQFIAQTQPMKMAAAEAHWETAAPAGLALFALIDEEAGQNTFEIKLPSMLSFMIHNNFNGEVKGIHDLQAEFVKTHGQGDYIPPVTATFWGFRAMVGSGSLMLFVALLGCLLLRSKDIHKQKLFLMLAMFSLFLPYIANASGWIVAEMGRQPWVVYNLQTVFEGVSASVPSSSILISLIGFTVLYGALAVADVYLLQKFAKKPPVDFTAPDNNSSEGSAKEGSLWI